VVCHHPIRTVAISNEALQLRDEIEVLIEQFHKKCNELKVAVRRLDQTPITNGDAALTGHPDS
jgi:hypothetical protein